MKILVTGGLGFVGLHCVQVLAGQPGVQVIAADRGAPSAEVAAFFAPLAQAIACVQLDVTDRRAVHDLIHRAEITHIVHGAAITASPEQEAANPTAIVDVNLGGTINILDAALAVTTVQRVITMSSSGVYAVPSAPTTDPIGEESALDLDNLYGITKFASERLTARYSQLCGKPMTSVRLASVYGPLEVPKSSRTHTSLVHRLLMATRENKILRVAKVSGGRDRIHAQDVGRAIWALLSAPCWQYEVYNISSGLSTPFAELIEMFKKHGLRVEWVDEVAEADLVLRPSQNRAPLDISRLRADTDFSPQWTLADGIAAL